jgi:hypothetical protein
VFRQNNQVMRIDREMQKQWILGNPIAGVLFNMNERVRIISGPDSGKVGTLISIFEIGKDPGFQIETNDDRDLFVRQSQLASLN